MVKSVTIGDTGPRRGMRSLPPRKTVDVVRDSRLARWLGPAKAKVNSLHHQAVKATGSGLCVAARDRDGIVQALESTEGLLRLGVQWHPVSRPAQAVQKFRRGLP